MIKEIERKHTTQFHSHKFEQIQQFEQIEINSLSFSLLLLKWKQNRKAQFSQHNKQEKEMQSN